jgi:hypothetical protein
MKIIGPNIGSGVRLDIKSRLGRLRECFFLESITTPICREISSLLSPSTCLVEHSSFGDCHE